MNIDALIVGVSYGAKKVKLPIISVAIISAISIICFFAARYAALFFGYVISDGVAKAIGLIILYVLGLYIILSTVMQMNKKDDAAFCDYDNSKYIDALEAVSLGFALSLDMLSVGIGITLGGMTSMAIPFVIAFTQAILLYAGAALCGFIRKLRLDPKYLKVASGIVLILLATIKAFY